MKKMYLVTTANGNTGYTTALELINKGLSVRAFVRNPESQKAQNLRLQGANVFKGNLDDFRDIEKALEGITHVYFCPPFDRDALLKTANFIVAAEAAGIEHVVYMSQWLASPAHPAINTREQWLSKQLAALHRKTSYTFINTGLFGFTYFFTIQMVTQLGIYPTLIAKDQLSKTALNAPPSEEDQGRVIAAILADPQKHKGKSYRITGPELISHQDVINTYSNVLGRPVRPMTIDKKMMFKSLKAMGFDTYQFTNVTHYMDELEQGTFSTCESVNNLVFELTGRKAESFETILRRELGNTSYESRTLSSVAKAIIFFAKTMFTPAPDLDLYEKKQNFPEFFNPTVFTFQNSNWAKEHLSAENVLPDTQNMQDQSTGQVMSVQ